MEDNHMNMIHNFVESDYHVDRIRSLLSERIDPNLKDEFGNTLLHTAAISLQINNKIARELINAGAIVNSFNKTGYTPLHYAAIRRKHEMVEILLQAGADINAATPSGNTALHYSINNRGCEFLRSTGFHKQQVPSTPDINSFIILLKDKKININSVGAHGETPLSRAVADRQICIVKALLYRRANPNICNAYGESPLHTALDDPRPCIEIVYSLLRFGADLCSVNKENRTPIDIVLDGIRDDESLIFAKMFVKLIALHYNLSINAVKNLEKNPEISTLQLICSKEVNLMITQIIARKLTVHDFLLRCFNEDQFEDMCLEIHKPLVDILLTGVYSAYLSPLLGRIGKFHLWKVLKYNIYLRNETEDFRSIPNEELIRMCINCFLYNHLSNWELFQLIMKNSNLTDSQISAIYPLEA